MGRSHRHSLALLVAVGVVLCLLPVLLDGLARCIEALHAAPTLALAAPLLLGVPLVHITLARAALASVSTSWRRGTAPALVGGGPAMPVRGGRRLGSTLAVRPPPSAEPTV